jgi:hypothetical protein
MKILLPEEIQQNWETFLGYIERYIESPRKEKLLDFYKQYEERFMMMPASHKSQYHNCFPGGYVDHVNRVINGALELHNVWFKMGVAITYSIEELVFSCINHDLGKFGTIEEFVQNFNDNAPFKDLYLKWCIGGKEYMGKTGYLNYDMCLPKSANNKFAFGPANTGKVLDYVEATHLKKLVVAEKKEFGTEEDDFSSAPNVSSDFSLD